MQSFPLLLSLALLGALGTSCKPEPKSAPNVILVTLDTTRADYFSSYGHPGGLTPNFDRLADEGVRFAFCNSSAAVTPVSHATIMTGRSNPGHGLRVLGGEGGYKLPEDVPTLATVLKGRGYRTLAVHSAFPVSGYFGFDRDFDVFDSFDSEMTIDEHGANWDGTTFQRRSDETTDRILALLEKERTEHADEPFFLWIHYWDPHDPIRTPPEEWLPPDLPRWRGQPRKSDLLYATELKYLDSQFGRLLDDLDEQGLAETTIVAVTADHGEGLDDGKARHDWSFHRILYREQIHVPLLIRGPGLGAAGRVVEGAVGNVDIAPTILELLDLPQPSKLDGSSLVSAARGMSLEPRAIYADQINGYDLNAKMLKNRPKAAFLYSVIESDWKLIYRPVHPADSELFDLRSDPLEEKNVWSEHPDQVLRLLRLLAERDGWVTQPFANGVKPSARTLQILSDIGYVAGEEGFEGEWGWICPTADLESAEIRNERGTCEESGLPMIPIRKLE